MVENLKTLCESLVWEIELFNPGLLRNEKLEFYSAKLMVAEELPERINFVHRNHKHDKRYHMAACSSQHCFQCLVERVKSRVLKCEHACELSPFEGQHILYLEKGFKDRI